MTAVAAIPERPLGESGRLSIEWFDRRPMSGAVHLVSSRLPVTTTIARPTTAESAPVAALILPGQILALPDVAWEQYVAVADALPDRPGLRITYDGESLELMTTSRRYEKWKELLGQLIEMLTFQLGIPRGSGGQTTFRDQLAEGGLEPDRCYWITHAPAITGESGAYQPIERSAAFPFLRVADLEQFLNRSPPISETVLMREFVDWIEQQGFRAD